VRHKSWLGRLALIMVAIAVLAFAAIGPTASAGATARPASPSSPVTTSYAKRGQLYGVAAVSGTNAWAVGFSGGGVGYRSMTLLLHWNGRRWEQVITPKPVPGVLYAVAAASATSVWAVGEEYNGTANGLVIVLHWDGKVWHRVPVPALAGPLTSVAAAGSQVWATDSNERGFLHLTGGHWYVVPMAATLLTRINGIAVVGGKTLWAAGYVESTASACIKTKMWGWTDSLWQSVSLPLQSGCGTLDAIAAGPHGTAFVVGEYATCLNCATEYVSLQWTGSKWRQVPVITDAKNGTGTGFSAVTSAPDGAAWAIAGFNPVIILRWTGTSWRQVPNGKFPTYTNLDAVAAASPSDAWAVGDYQGPDYVSTTLILHWNGKTWS
jgi:hypothetical protein